MLYLKPENLNFNLYTTYLGYVIMGGGKKLESVSICAFKEFDSSVVSFSKKSQYGLNEFLAT